jgi:YidB-like protein
MTKLSLNAAISPDELERSLGEDNIRSLAEQAGIPRQELLSSLIEDLPASSISSRRKAGCPARRKPAAGYEPAPTPAADVPAAARRRATPTARP